MQRRSKTIRIFLIAFLSITSLISAWVSFQDCIINGLEVYTILSIIFIMLILIDWYEIETESKNEEEVEIEEDDEE